MLRFVVQQHSCDDSLHWDIMLEQGNNLATWQIDQPPTDWSAQPLPCRQLPDHRLAYLDYQGPISNGRGSVKIVAKGKYKTLEINENCCHISTYSDEIQGTIHLTRTARECWQLTFSTSSKQGIPQ